MYKFLKIFCIFIKKKKQDNQYPLHGIYTHYTKKRKSDNPHQFILLPIKQLIEHIHPLHSKQKINMYGYITTTINQYPHT